MKIYIPAHLKKLEFIRDLDLMIKEYSKNFYDESNESFNDYYYSLKEDPIQKFIELRLPDINEDQDREVIIKYITKLFYSVKGTTKVFDYMRKYLSLEVGDIIYNTRYIEIRIDKLVLDDEGSFSEAFIDFLRTLLYFEDIQMSMDSIGLVISGSYKSECSIGFIPYKLHKPLIYSL